MEWDDIQKAYRRQSMWSIVNISYGFVVLIIVAITLINIRTSTIDQEGMALFIQDPISDKQWTLDITQQT